jgi:hypothetical protein
MSLSIVVLKSMSLSVVAMKSMSLYLDSSIPLYSQQHTIPLYSATYNTTTLSDILYKSMLLYSATYNTTILSDIQYHYT